MSVGYLDRAVGRSVSAVAVQAATDWSTFGAIRGLRFETNHVSSAKRVFDVIAATVLLALAAPMMLVVAILIRLDSPGPILIAQERVGLDLRRFGMLKFRSMVRDADRRRDALQHLNDSDGPLFKIRRDPRVTRVGAFLRRTSLDELPQLVNVIRGEMSLVGPRPPFPGEVLQDRLRQSLRLRCRPGMTGLWQVNGRSSVGYEAMLRMDMRYLQEASLRTDVTILLRTIPAVIGGKGAW